MKDQIIAQFIEYRNDFIQLLPKLATAIVLLIIFWGFGRLISRLFANRFQRRWDESIVVSFTGTALKGLLYLIGFAIAMYVLGFGGIAGSLVAGAGVSAIVIGFAFKDIAENFLAGFILAINRPFRLNDIIEIENYKGTVTKLNIRTTLMKMPDGRDVFIPNALLIKGILTNYTRDGYNREEFMLGLETDADIKKARSLILHALSEEPTVLKQPKPDLSVENMGNGSINVKVMFWIDSFAHSEKQEDVIINESIKSRMLRRTKDLLLKEGYHFPSYVLEHKMYPGKGPISVNVEETN